MEECEEVHQEKLIICKSCGYRPTGEDPQPETHQVVDLPVIKPLIIEYRLHELECEHCAEKTRAPLPERALHSAVIGRRRSFGSQSAALSYPYNREFPEFPREALKS